MPVPEQIPHITYTTDGRTTDFPLTFDCPDQAHLIVSLDDMEVEIGQWALSNSNVVFNSPPTSNSVLSIERSTPLKRTRNYETNNNSFRPGPLNRDFDSIWRKLQELGYRDSVLLAKLIQEINTRIRDDKALNSKVSAIDTRVSENEIDIAILSEKLAKEILQRTQADRKLKSLIYGMLDEAINEGTVNALAVIHVDSVDELSYVQAWDGRTVYVKNVGFYKYSTATLDWEISYISDKNILSYSGENQTLINRSIIRQISSISALRSYEPIRNDEIIQTSGYYEGSFATLGLVQGGSQYYYDSSDKKTLDDGLFTIVTQNGARWKILLKENKINAYQCGLKLQGIDETNSFKKIISTIQSYSVLRLQRIELLGLENKVKVSDTIAVDVNYVLLNGFTFYVDPGFTPTSMMAILKLDGNVEEIKTIPTRTENIVIQGPEWRTNKLITGLLCLPDKNLNLLEVSKVKVFDCKYGLCLGSNTYLISFHKLALSRCDICMVDSVTAGFETLATNAGENISFHEGVWGESNQFAKINSYNNGSYFSFNNVSFDYSGGKDSQSFVQFDLNKGQYDFNDCHHESGNSNDRVSANYFNLGDYTNVNLKGGWAIFSAKNFIPYFFFCTGENNDRAKDPRINVDSTWLYAPSVQWWANRGLDYFKPNIAVSDYTTSGKWQELNTMMTNGDMSRSGLLDAYFANYNDTYKAANIAQTDSQNNGLLSVTWNASAGAVQMSRLQQTNASGLTGGIFYLLVPRQSSRYNPNVQISYKTDTNVDLSSGSIYITATPVRWSSQYDIVKQSNYSYKNEKTSERVDQYNPLAILFSFS